MHAFGAGTRATRPRGRNTREKHHAGIRAHRNRFWRRGSRFGNRDCARRDWGRPVKTLYTAKNAGCYADGARGLAEQRFMLADLVAAAYAERPEMPKRLDVIDALHGELSDDDSETDAALEILNSVTSGATWQFVDSDLMLVADEEE